MIKKWYALIKKRYMANDELTTIYEKYQFIKITNLLYQNYNFVNYLLEFGKFYSGKLLILQNCLLINICHDFRIIFFIIIVKKPWILIK